MDFKGLYKKVITPESNDVDKKWYLAPLYPAILWVIFSIISIFTIDTSILSDPFVIISLLARLAFPFYSLLFIRKFYISGGLKPINYNHMLNFIGYSIALTYVSYMLPGVVLDFHNSGASAPVFTILVMLSTLCPISLYLLLKNPKVKYASSYFTLNEIEREKKVKKDKKLKKENHKKLRKERTLLQNVWFEVLDPLMWAILWVLLINNTLFQLYVIPSSSMVPEFLEKDRVVASKLFSGPGIPLTRYQLPKIKTPKTGEIVTFNNPKVDDPDSTLHYKNVFTRIFQPFFFMLSFSKLDIDADANGSPQARQLVKRVIAVPGEKFSMVNDKVYKKIEGGEWTLMSDIPGEKEWGKNNLFSLDNKNSGNQYMNPKLRSELDEAAELVLSMDINELESDLSKKKAEFLRHIGDIDDDGMIIFLNTLMSYNRKNVSKVTETLGDIERSYGQMMQLNRSGITEHSKKNIVKEFNENLDRYKIFILFDKINDLGNIIQGDVSVIENDFKTDLVVPSNPSPYDFFTIKLDGLIRLRTLELYNYILSTMDFNVTEDLIRELKILYVYTNGLQLRTYIQPFFGAGNFPEYPAGTGNYIPEGEYFLLGDNRYNSLDSRMGDSGYELSLDHDNNVFSEKVLVSWAPHTISDYYIHGKVSFILFPFSHFKLF